MYVYQKIGRQSEVGGMSWRVSWIPFFTVCQSVDWVRFVRSISEGSVWWRIWLRGMSRIDLEVLCVGRKRKSSHSFWSRLNRVLDDLKICRRTEFLTEESIPGLWF